MREVGRSGFARGQAHELEIEPPSFVLRVHTTHRVLSGDLGELLNRVA